MTKIQNILDFENWNLFRIYNLVLCILFFDENS
jgi:hypothetical protein